MKLYRTTAKAYFVKDEATGDKYKIERSWCPQVYFNGGDDGVYIIDAMGRVFDSKHREWVEESETWFYPAAPGEVVSKIDEALGCLPHNK